MKPKLDYKVNVLYNKDSYTLGLDNYSPHYFLLFKNEYKNNEFYSIEVLLKNSNLSNFKFFFKNLNLNIPSDLNKVESIKKLVGKTSYYQLNQFLMKSGKKLSSLKLLQHFYFSLLKSINNLNKLQSNFIYS